MPLFPDQLLPEPAPELAACLADLESALGDAGVADLPPFRGLARGLVVRWLYRAWIAEHEPWRALVHVDPRYCTPPHGLEGAFQQAAGGWIFFDADWQPHGDRDTLAAKASQHACRLLLAVDAPAVPVPAGLQQRIQLEDHFHLAAVDPSIAHLRRALFAYCKARSIVHLWGPSGCGKRSLVHWVHARLDTRPLSCVRQGTGPPPAGNAWQLYEEIAQLDAGQLVKLRERLHEDEDLGSEFRAVAGGETTRPQHDAFDEIVGASPALCRVLHKAARYGPSGLPLLILGKTGTGKELLARAVHTISRRVGRFVALDLTTRSETLLEGALFGHVKGAFTGATQVRKGALLDADGGTLFLDELGNLGLSAQAKLLRVLEYGEVLPLGADRPVQVDVRIVAATNADLESMVRLGEFREDFLFRFNLNATLRLPALKDRGEDIVLLAESLLGRMRGIAAQRFGAEARELLMAWDWPGNVRELRHAVEAAAIECDKETVGPEHLPSLSQAVGGAPALLTSSQPPEERLTSWPLSRSEIQKATAVTLQVPPLSERDPRAVRSAVLGLLGGRPISGEALGVLERRVWWGNFSELHRVLQTLCSNIRGPIDLASLHTQMPDLLQRESLAPIKVMVFPSIRNGRVVGLERTFLDNAVLVGRIEHLDVLAPAASDGERLQRRWLALAQLFGDARPGCLNLSFLGRLSRAHLAITREDRGLVVHTLPDPPLPVFAGPFPGGEPFRVEAEAPVFLGESGEIRVLTAKGGLYLHLLVACGELPQVDARSAERFLRPPAGKTLGTPKQRVTIWTLSATEIASLVPLVLAALRSESFAGRIRAWGRKQAASGAQTLWKLASYLDSSHPTQSASRLFAHEPNDGLREAFAAQLAHEDGARQLWLKLPVGIRRCVELPVST